MVGDRVVIATLARTRGSTGVEMEALTAASVAALTVYDMCKAASKDLLIGPIRLLEKSGGHSGHWQAKETKRGRIARVWAGGALAVGDAVAIEQVVERSRFQAVVLTLSDRCAAGTAQDTAGPAVADLLRDSLPAHIYTTEILPDGRTGLAERLRHYADGHGIDLVVAVGGTGTAPRDETPEAIRDVVERLTPGFDEAMRQASLAVTPLAMLSRACSGIRGATLILSLPGSERAAVDNLRAVLPALSHGLAKLRGDPADCGRRTL